MAASEGVGRASARPRPQGESKGGLKSALPLAMITAGSIVALCFFPFFRIVPLHSPASAKAAPADAPPAAFDAVVAAAKIWQTDLPAAAARALELKTLLPAVRANAESAKTKFARSAGLGAAYYFARGSGKVVACERNFLHVAPDGDASQLIALRIGPVFGNTVRDGCGFLDVNAFPGLQEFNALSAELNALVERTILPTLRAKGVVGVTVSFAGCAEAPESAPEAGEPLLTLVPVQVEFR